MKQKQFLDTKKAGITGFLVKSINKKENFIVYARRRSRRGGLPRQQLYKRKKQYSCVVLTICLNYVCSISLSVCPRFFYKGIFAPKYPLFHPVVSVTDDHAQDSA